MLNTERCHAPGECFCDRCCLKIVNDNLCNYISKSSLPPLPAGWCGPFTVFGWNSSYAVVSDNTAIIDDLTKDEAMFLVALLNVTHPSPKVQK